MKLKYKFVSGEEVEIEVTGDLESVLIEIERIDNCKERAETRRHRSIFDLEDQGVQFFDEAPSIEDQIEKTLETELMLKVISELTPDQQTLIRKVYFAERTLTSIAAEEGVNKSTISKRLLKIHEQIKKSLI